MGEHGIPPTPPVGDSSPKEGSFQFWSEAFFLEWQKPDNKLNYDWLSQAAARVGQAGSHEQVAELIRQATPAFARPGQEGIFRSHALGEIAYAFGEKNEANFDVIAETARAFRKGYEAKRHPYLLMFMNSLLPALSQNKVDYAEAGQELVRFFGMVARDKAANPNKPKSVIFMPEYKSFWAAIQLGPPDVMHDVIQEELGQMIDSTKDTPDPFYRADNSILLLGDPRFWQAADPSVMIYGLRVLQANVRGISELQPGEFLQRRMEAIALLTRIPKIWREHPEVQPVITECEKEWIIDS